MSRSRAEIEADIVDVRKRMRALPDSAVRQGFADDYRDDLDELLAELQAAK